MTYDSASRCPLGVPGMMEQMYSCGSEYIIVHLTALELARCLWCRYVQLKLIGRHAGAKTSRWSNLEFRGRLDVEGKFSIFLVPREDTVA